LFLAVLGLLVLSGVADLAAWEGGPAAARGNQRATAFQHTRALTEPVTATSAILVPLLANSALFLPPPLPPPVPVAMTEPFDVESVRAALDAAGKELGLPRIGFHVGPDDGDTDPELLAWMAALDGAGIPFVLKSVDNAEPVLQALQMKEASGVPHVIIYRRSGDAWDVPYYNMPPDEAAVIHWERHRDNFPPELRPYKDQLWLETVNEIDKERAAWLGLFAQKTAELALADGYNWAAFGWAAGEPDAEDWREPAMLDFLRLAGQHPDRLAIALHEYSYDPDEVGEGYPWMVGRFQLLYEVTDTEGIPRPTILITEWGWTHEELPAPAAALEQIAWANWLYAAYPQVKGAAIWYLGPNFGGISAKAQLLIEPVRDYSLRNYFEVEPGWGKVDVTLFWP
jgi:hypothetical protein